MSRRDKNPDRDFRDDIHDMIESELFSAELSDMDPELRHLFVPTEDQMNAIIAGILRSEAAVHSHRTRAPAPPPPPRPLTPYIPLYPGPPRPLPQYRYVAPDGHTIVPPLNSMPSRSLLAVLASS